MPHTQTSMPVAFASGLVAGLAVTLVLGVSRLAGLTPLNLEVLLGSFITSDTQLAAWMVGFTLHLLLSGATGCLYALAFRAVGHAGGDTGAGFGLAHALFCGLFLAVLPAIHPLVAEQIAAPGFLARNYGGESALLVFLCHVLYGAVVGELCRLPQSVGTVAIALDDEPAYPLHRSA